MEGDTEVTDGPRASSGPSGRTDWTEVRLLGPLRVRRADGGHVQDRDWRTGKNADLLRWLALQAGEPVPVDVLADGLWPDADEARARSSLRTAVAQLRRVLGADAVERVAAGLVLSGCWVDAPAYVQLADDVDRHLRAGRYTEAFAAAVEADALYVADMVVGEGAPAALVEHANALSNLRHRLLGDAAEAALEMGWVRDAVDFARRLSEVDGVSERASRVLMLGHAATGEVHHALAEFERIREVLADELGVDPSPQTRAAHLQVLQPVPATPVEPPFVGRASELHWLSTVLDDVRRTAERTPVVVLSGPDGSGRHRLAVTACEDDGLAWSDVGPGQSVRQAALGAQGKALLWRPDPTADAAQLGLLASGAEPVDGPAVLLALLPCAGELPVVDEVLRDAAVRSLQLQPLLVDDVAALAQRLLSGPPLPSLIAELHHLSGGLPGRVLELLAEWGSSGRLTATSRGLALAPRAGVQEHDPSGRRALSRALPRLEGDALEALQVSALLDQAVTPGLLAPLLAAPDANDNAVLRARATAALEQLVDLGLLRNSAAGAVWRHPLLRDAVHGWMRPAVTQRLHRRIAGQAPMSSAARVEHWLAAGERELACVAALEAAAECSARGDHAGARTHLLEVCSLGDLPEALADDRVDLFESLGDACAALRRPEEARAAYVQALDLALAALLPCVVRLRRKLEGVSDPRSLELGRLQPAADDSSVLSGLGVLAADMLDIAQLEDSLKDVVEQADRRHDQRRAVGGRLQMAAAVCLPRRDFRAAHQLVEAALALDPRPVDRLRAVVVRHVTAVLLGGAATARTALRDAAVAAEAAGEQALQTRLLGMRVLVAHDLGDPEFEVLWRRLEQRVTSGGVDEMVPELAAIGLRVLAEREELDRATTMSAHLALAGGQSWPLLSHLARLAGAELAEGVGDHRQAADLLRSVVDEGTSTGCTLFVPEAAARLVVLETEHDRAAARTAFEVYDEVVGATMGGPREEFWKRLSRAAVRASHGDTEGAAAACGQASSLATKHGLQVLAARARRSRTDYLRSGGSVRSRRGDEALAERNVG